MLYQLSQVVKKFKVLNIEERQKGPKATYNNAEQYLAINKIKAKKVESETRAE